MVRVYTRSPFKRSITRENVVLRHRDLLNGGDVDYREGENFLWNSFLLP